MIISSASILTTSQISSMIASLISFMTVSLIIFYDTMSKTNYDFIIKRFMIASILRKELLELTAWIVWTERMWSKVV